MYVFVLCKFYVEYQIVVLMSLRLLWFVKCIFNTYLQNSLEDNWQFNFNLAVAMPKEVKLLLIFLQHFYLYRIQIQNKFYDNFV